MTSAREDLALLTRSLPFGLGDVLVLEDGEEAWLAGATLVSEDAPIAVLFRAPAARVDRAVYLRAVPPHEAAWLVLARSERAPLEPPSSLEEDGFLYTRTRRLPVQLTRVDDASFDVEGTAVVGEYRGPSDRRIVRVSTSEVVMTFVGRKLAPQDYDRLPGQ